ncbi:MAG: AsmA family protein [Methylococcales symbiont of Iophon sp. n. MRB-2018]|nr:MAG: AsmA family protein [Methylococcales symbiont of Iophon sp. n. MRB-2018]KAF3979579.1 MAG: AsmA family protein [Methylococcales symbiont of Iophon sp. n. MRB-2018]
MSKFLKVLLSIFAAFVLLITIAVIVIPFFINPNDFKAEIVTMVKDNSGRDLAINGDLKVSIFPWLGISTGKLVLSNAKGFGDKPFAEINASNVKIKLIPLFSKQIKVSKIVLKGLVLNLAKNKQGISNWEDLSKQNQSVEKKIKTTKQDTQKQEKVAQKSESNETMIPLAGLAIGSISIEQAKISWDDQQKGNYTEINALNFITDKLVFGKAISLDLSFSIFNKEPELTESIDFTTDLIINEALDNFKLTKIKIKSVTSGNAIPGGELIATLLAEVAIDMSQQTLNISKLNLNANNLSLTANIKGTQIVDKPNFSGSIAIAEFNLASLMSQIAMPLPEMEYSTAMSKTSMRLSFQSSQDLITINDLSVNLDDSHINGSVKIKNFEALAINFDLKVDNIDIDRYMPVDDENTESQTIADFTGKPSPQPKKAAKAVFTSAKAAAVTTLFPVETLRDLNANGQITVDQLKIDQLNMKGLSFKLKAKNGVINTQQKVKHFYQGSYSGSTSINVQGNTPRLSLSHKLATVQIEPLLKDNLGEAKMTGVVNASIKIKGQGNTEKALKSSLNGDIGFSFKDGTIKGFNLQKIINKGKTLIGKETLTTGNKNDQTVFSIIKGTAKITNGLISNKDLYAKASKLRVNGKGTAHLVSEKMDYVINAKLIKTEATATKSEKIKGIPIAINIAGTFTNPSYKLDLVAMLAEKNKEKINKKKDALLKKLDEKLGSGISDLLKGLF